MHDLYEFSFNLQQFILGICLLFFLFIAWNDRRVINYSNLSNPSKMYNFLFILFYATMISGLFVFCFESWGYQGIMLSLEFAILITLAVYHPKYGLAFMIYLLVARPWETFEDPLMLSMIKDVTMLVIASHIGHSILRRDLSFKWNMPSTWALLFSIWTFMGAFLSYHSSEAITDYINVFSKNIIVFYLILNLVKKRSDITPSVITFILAIVGQAITSYYGTFVIGPGEFVALDSTPGEGHQRLEGIGMLGNANDMAAILLMLLPVLLAWLKRSSNKYLYRVAGSSFGLALLWLVWMAKSRGAVLAILSIGVVYFILKIKNKKIIITAVLGITLCIPLLFMALNRKSGDLEESASNRKIFWISGLNMVARNPIFGVGYQGFPLYVHDYALETATEGGKRTAHSSWILVLAESGLPGFAFFFFLFGSTLYRAWLMRKIHPEYLYSVTSYGVAMSFLSHSYILCPYVIWGLTIVQFDTIKGQLSDTNTNTTRT